MPIRFFPTSWTVPLAGFGESTKKNLNEIAVVHNSSCIRIWFAIYSFKMLGTKEGVWFLTTAPLFTALSPETSFFVFAPFDLFWQCYFYFQALTASELPNLLATSQQIISSEPIQSY